jgi:pilus assembly protein Flp/PilA
MVSSEGFTMTRMLESVRCLLARAHVKAVLKQEEGASLVEYGLLVGLIAVVCIGAITLLGQDISSLFSRIAAKLEGVAP